MKTPTASLLFALAASLSVNCIPVQPVVQELSSRSEVIGLDTRQPIRGNEALGSSYENRRDDITIIEARMVTVEDRGTSNLEHEAEKRGFTLASANATATASLSRGDPIREREPEPKKTVEPPCLDVSSSTDAGCTINLRA